MVKEKIKVKVKFRECEYIGIINLNELVTKVTTPHGTTIPGMEETVIYLTSEFSEAEMITVLQGLFCDHEIELMEVA